MGEEWSSRNTSASGDGQIVMQVEQSDLWFVLAGFLGAFGNQLLYWRSVVSRRRQVHAWMVVASVLYLPTGGGVGFFTGLEFESLLLALGVGGGWPTALKAMNDARLIAAAARKKLGLDDGE